MVDLSFALHEAYENGASIDLLARVLSLPLTSVEEHIEAARLGFFLPNDVSTLAAVDPIALLRLSQLRLGISASGGEKRLEE